VLFNEPKLLKWARWGACLSARGRVSVLFNEPKLLKLFCGAGGSSLGAGFSALQRAEIAEI